MFRWTRIIAMTIVAACLTMFTIIGCGGDDNNGKTPVTPPGTGNDSAFGAPSGVVAFPVSSERIDLVWNPVFSATEYYVFTSRSQSGTYTKLATTTSAFYENVGLSPNTTYYYKIYASNGNDVSNESVVVFATTGENGTVVKGTFTDSRDGKKYKTVEMPDGKIWLGENLNYKPTTGGSWCYDNKESNCDIYGRLYDWATAMNISSFYNTETWDGSDENHQGVCPNGWHLPSKGEWEKLITAVGENAGTKLKATTGWETGIVLGVPNGTDEFGFSALPGGQFNLAGFDNNSYVGFWWTSTQSTTILIGSGDERVIKSIRDNIEGNSVRCIQS